MRLEYLGVVTGSAEENMAKARDAAMLRMANNPTQQQAVAYANAKYMNPLINVSPPPADAIQANLQQWQTYDDTIGNQIELADVANKAGTLLQSLMPPVQSSNTNNAPPSTSLFKNIPSWVLIALPVAGLLFVIKKRGQGKKEYA